ncbi:MAG: GHKL domain-containing protein [Tannerella sp.]|jgi:nitrogen fixation/metabolism regulation signal transduction histidine kinase|nr:GHKL domain-containing protein [Tannerella sp.]
MIPKGFFQSLTFLLTALTALTAAATYFAMQREWIPTAFAAMLWLSSILSVRKLFKRHADKISLMFDAIDNSDYAFKFAAGTRFMHDRMVNRSLNRITQIFLQAKADAIRKEKYYELILNSISTGVIAIDDRGYVSQTNSETLRILALPTLTHTDQLRRVDMKLATLIAGIRPGEKHQISFANERETVSLSIRASGMTLREKFVRIIVINDIRSELEEKEVESWIRLMRVLTHEIMNAVTPITSLSRTLLDIHGNADAEIRNGLEVICSTGRGLISFVDSYRKFTRIPMPKPSLFYVRRFIEGTVQLLVHRNRYPNIEITIRVSPDDLILHADENLIGLVMLNILKNALQAIGHEQPDGRIDLKAFCNEAEAVIIEVANNGPAIPPDEAEHIFLPFFTTREGGSGIGLSVARQIMQRSGGSIALKNAHGEKKTVFVLTFP